MATRKYGSGILAEEYGTSSRSQRLQSSRLSKEELRRRAAETVEGLISGSQGEVSAIQQAQGRGRAALRSQAARALASNLTPGLSGSGAGAAQARQSSLDVGTSLAAMEPQQAQQLADVRRRAAETELEGLSFLREMGTEEDARKQRQAELEQQIQMIKEKNTGIVSDEGEQAAKEIRALAEYEDDPVIRQWIENRARQTETELEDWSFLGL